jgi:D-alanyl-D-alanine carboxypeptidase
MPTDDLCNYIENKAANDAANALAAGSGGSGQAT